MKITHATGLFRAHGFDDEQRKQLAGLGWKYLKLARTIATSNVANVAPFKDACEGEAKKRVDAFIAKRREAIAGSVASTASITIPAPEDCVYRPYQKAGIAFMLGRKDSLNADEPRLGKTVQTMGVVNATPGLRKVLIVCQANTKTQWLAEYRKWTVHPHLTSGVISGRAFPAEIPDVCVINYDILYAHKDWMHDIEWDILVVDEAHNLSSTESKRTEVLLGKGRRPEHVPLRARRRLFLTGTPIYTRPIGVWPLARACDPHDLGKNWWHFVERYCGATKENGWDTTGYQNEAELQFRMRKAFMIRREKHEVLEEIPSQRYTVVLPKAGLEHLVNAEMKQFADKLAEFQKEALQEAELIGLDPLSAFDTPVIVTRQDLALAKMRMCIEWIEELLTAEKKIIVFAHHRAVVEKLRDALAKYGAAVVYGGMTSAQRDAEKDRFQTDPSCRVFIGNIHSAGSGISLSAADTVVYVEMAWSPSAMDQADARPWLPEKTTPISIYRLVVEDSLDMALAAILDARQQSIQKAMSKKFMHHEASSLTP